MDNNGFIKERKQPLLTGTGILAVAAGLVLLYFGFFMLMDSNNSISPDLTVQQHKILKYLAIGGIYLMVNGGFSVVCGFYGAVNSGLVDNHRKCSIYGWVLLAFSVVNVLIMTLITDVAGNQFNIILLLVPILIAVMYCLGAFLNQRMIQERLKENES